MRRYVIEVPGDNDDLHQKALKEAVDVIQNKNHVGVQSAVVIAPPGDTQLFVPILNCTRRVK